MEALGQLAGGIAHDFNNLLTAILGYASVLRDESREGTEARGAAETVIAAARRAADLTRQLLRFSRREPLNRVPFDAHEVLREAMRLLARTLGARIRIVERYGAPRAVVVGDAGQFQQAIVNLAVNARDAMPAGGELVLETREVERRAGWCALQPGTLPGPYLAVTVGDTGHGIPESVRERIFDPFFTTKEPGSGTGLGLAVVYGIARSHGGAVEVSSTEGLGTRFVLSLPLAPADTDAIAPATEPPARRGAQETVLLVDDDRLPREAVAAMLRSLGYAPVAASSCDEAVRWLQEEERDVRIALIDVAMPGSDGVACFGILRRLLPDVPLMFISGHETGERAQGLAREGKAAFLPKPFDLKGLATAIDAALSGPA
jgi:CheY-like chemotaxis protein